MCCFTDCHIRYNTTDSYGTNLSILSLLHTDLFTEARTAIQLYFEIIAKSTVRLIFSFYNSINYNKNLISSYLCNKNARNNFNLTIFLKLLQNYTLLAFPISASIRYSRQPAEERKREVKALTFTSRVSVIIINNAICLFFPLKGHLRRPRSNF